MRNKELVFRQHTAVLAPGLQKKLFLQREKICMNDTHPLARMPSSAFVLLQFCWGVNFRLCFRALGAAGLF